MSYVDCVLLTSQEVPATHPDDLALSQSLQDADVRTQILPWEEFFSSGIDCENVIFRTAWGYYRKIPEFKKFLEDLSRASISVWNPLDTIRWNLHKRYLLQLEKKGIPIIPTVMVEKGKPLRLVENAEHLDTDLLVIKPAIGASGIHTQLIDLAKIKDQSGELAELNKQHDLLIQPFVSEIQSEGEYSLIFIDNQFTHCILKRPQEKGFIVKGTPHKISCPPRALNAAKKILETAQQDHLYARVDLVMHEGNFVLMELELIEPELWLPLESQASELFASAISKRL